MFAVCASALAAFIFPALSLREEITEFVETYIMLLGSFLVGGMVIWMSREASAIRQVDKRIDIVVNRKPGVMECLGLFSVVFMLVFRESAETILLISALSSRIGSNLFEVTSTGLVGVGIAALLGLFILKGLVRINPRVFFSGARIVFLTLMGWLAVNVVYNFAQFGVISLTTQQLSFMMLLAREDISILIMCSFIGVPAIMVILTPLLKSSAAKEVVNESSAQRRLRLAAERRMLILRGCIGILMLIILGIVDEAFWTTATSTAVYDPSPLTVAPEEGKVKILLSDLSDGLLHKYSVAARGVFVRFFMIQHSGIVRVALDACQICPPVGYYMQGENIVCKNCGAPINIDTIGMAGGCNPRPLRFNSDGSHLLIDFADLESSAQYFVVH